MIRKEYACNLCSEAFDYADIFAIKQPNREDCETPRFCSPDASDFHLCQPCLRNIVVDACKRGYASGIDTDQLTPKEATDAAK